MCQELQIFEAVVPKITDFLSCIYVFVCRLSLVRLCGTDFRITPVDYITIGITCAALCFHIAHIGTAMSIKKVFFVFLYIKVMSGRLKGTVLSVSMLLFQYSLKFSYSSILAGVYL